MNHFSNDVKPEWAERPCCTECGVLLPDEPTHVSGIWIDGRIRWQPSCVHVPVLGAQIRLGSTKCCYRYLARHPEECIGVRWVMLTGGDV